MDAKAVSAIGVSVADIQKRATALQQSYLRDSYGNMLAAAAEYAGLRGKLTSAAAQLDALNSDRFVTGAAPQPRQRPWRQ